MDGETTCLHGSERVALSCVFDRPFLLVRKTPLYKILCVGECRLWYGWVTGGRWRF